MFCSLMRYGFLCLVFLSWNARGEVVTIASGSFLKSQNFSVVMHQPFFAVAASLEAEPQDVDRQFDRSESKSQHAQRMNRNLSVGVLSLLILLVVGRALLLWQIARNRKKLAQENILETKA